MPAHLILLDVIILIVPGEEYHSRNFSYCNSKGESMVTQLWGPIILRNPKNGGDMISETSVLTRGTLCRVLEGICHSHYTDFPTPFTSSLFLPNIRIMHGLTLTEVNTRDGN
jgi:hypothetical protein